MPGLIYSANEMFFPYTDILRIIQYDTICITLLFLILGNSYFGCEKKILTEIDILLLTC